MRFLESIRDGLAAVERVRKADEDWAVALLQAHSDKAYTFSDALSFVMADRLGIRDAIAFDRHFREHGRLNLLGAGWFPSSPVHRRRARPVTCVM